jgi:hypothetical protein
MAERGSRIRRVGKTGKGWIMREVNNRTNGRVREPAKVRSFINRVLDDLDSLEVDKALKIPLSDLPNSPADTLAILRSAAGKKGMDLRLQTERDFLYVWNAPQNSTPI